MTRKSHQSGWLEKYRGKLYMRYRLRGTDNKWICPRIELPENISHKEARGMLDAELTRVNRLNNVPVFRPQGTLREFTEGVWQSYLEIKEVRESTRDSYDSILRVHILPLLGDKVLARITPADVTKCFEALKVSPKTRSNVYALLDRVFKVAKDHEIVDSIPIKETIHKAKQRKSKKEAWPAARIAAIIMLSGEYKALFWTVAVMGVRLGELLGLQWLDVDFERMEIAIKRTIYRKRVQEHPKTDSSEASLPIPGPLGEVLRERRDASRWAGPGDFVFARADGTPPDPDHLRRSVLYPILRELGITPKPRQHGFHIFRHSAGSIVSTAQGLKVAQEYLRHADFATTANIYVHLDDGELRKATELLAQQFSSVIESDKIQ